MKISRSDFEKLAAFRYALRRFLRFSEEAASQAGLSPQQHQALLAIQGFPRRNRVTISELAERLQLEHHSVVGLVQRLARERLVVREPSKSDRRVVFVRVSDRGKKLLQELTASHRQNLVRMAPEMIAALEDLARTRV